MVKSQQNWVDLVLICMTCWFFMQPSITIDGSVIRTTDSVLDLGVIIWADMFMIDQISAVIHSCDYNIKQLNSICASLTRDALRDAAYALVISRIDCCNLPCGFGVSRIEPLSSSA